MPSQIAGPRRTARHRPGVAPVARAGHGGSRRVTPSPPDQSSNGHARRFARGSRPYARETLNEIAERGSAEYLHLVADDFAKRRTAIPELVAALRVPSVERAMKRADELIAGVARDYALDKRAVIRQVRLHCPRRPLDELTSDPVATVTAIVSDLSPRLKHVSQMMAEFRQRSKARRAAVGTRVRRRGRRSFVGDKHGDLFPLAANVVPAETGFHIQTELHYLHCDRSDTSVHFGAYIPGADAPIAYVAFSPCRSDDQHASLERFLGEPIPESKTLVLTRAWGVAPLPWNVMSWTIGQAIAYVRRAHNARVVLTAVNPMLGFEGSIFMGTNFRPITTRPVAYEYSKAGFYTTPRLGNTHERARWMPPRNLILARPTDSLDPLARLLNPPSVECH